MGANPQSSRVPPLVDQVGESVDHLVVKMVEAEAHHTTKMVEAEAHHTSELAEENGPPQVPPPAVMEEGEVTAAHRAVEDLLEGPAAVNVAELCFENGNRILTLERWRFTRRWTLSNGNRTSRRIVTKINVHWPT